MKAWLLASVLLLLVWPRVVLAQAASAGFQIEFETAMRVTVKVEGLDGKVCATDAELATRCAACPANGCPKECDDGQRVYRVTSDHVTEHSLVSTGPLDTRSAPELAWVSTLLTRDQVSCADANGKVDPVTVALGDSPGTLNSDKKSSTLQLDGGLGPDPALPNVLVWTGWEHPQAARLVRKILPDDLSTKDCKIATGTGAPVKCTATRSPVAGGVRLMFSYSGTPFTSGKVTLAVSDKLTFETEIFACDYQATDRLARALFAGAMLQRLEFASSSECTARLAGNAIRFVNGSVSIVASEMRAGAGGVATLALSNVPANVPGGSWQLETTSGTHLGTASLPVVNEPVKVAGDASGVPALDIHYIVDAKGVELNQWHDGQSVDGQAVVTAARGEHYQYIQNTATIQVSKELRNLTRRLTRSTYEVEPEAADEKTSEKEGTDTATDLCDKPPPRDCDELDEFTTYCGLPATKPDSTRLNQCRSMRRAWRVTSNSWEQHSWIHEDGMWSLTGIASPARNEELGQITFAVFYPQRQPYTVTVELLDRTGPNATPGTESEDDVVFRMQLVLARGARYESLPLPLAQALHVECGEAQRSRGLFPSQPPPTDATLDVVTNGHTRAVNDEDVTTGNCRLVYSYQRVLRALTLDDTDASIDVLKYYGRQELTLTVRRGQAEQQVVWSIDPSIDTSVRLPIPADARNATGIYTVVATLRGRLPPAVIYRPGASIPQTGTSAAMGDLEFKANLRPRGPFGWKVAPIRAFMTFPVNFTGIRFPARPEELDKSSASTSVQVTSVEVGALLAVEPWNYDTGRNLWPVPIRFMTGANLYNVTEATASPSWITGASITFPIFDLQKGVAEDQLGTDVAVGLFWEVDVTQKDWISTGHHFLATLGVNLLSLFGSK